MLLMSVMSILLLPRSDAAARTADRLSKFAAAKSITSEVMCLDLPRTRIELWKSLAVRASGRAAAIRLEAHGASAAGSILEGLPAPEQSTENAS
jgi:hypothetical protein